MVAIVAGILLIGTVLSIIGVLGSFGTAMVAGAGIIIIGVIAGAVLIPIKTFCKILWTVSIIFLFLGLITMFFTGVGFLFLIAAAVIGGIGWLLRMMGGPENTDSFLFSKKK